MFPFSLFKFHQDEEGSDSSSSDDDDNEEDEAMGEGAEVDQNFRLDLMKVLQGQNALVWTKKWIYS